MNKFLLTYIFIFFASMTVGAQNPLGGLKKLQDAAKGAQDAAGKAVKGAQDAVKGAQDAAGKAAKSAQDAAKGAQDAAGKAAKGAQDTAQKAQQAVGQALQNLAQNSNGAGGAPAIRVFSLTPDTPYTDSLSLATKDGTNDLTVTFTYNQDESTLTVKMESDKILHVFRKDAAYKDIIHNGFLIFKPRRLNIFKLPYEVDSPADAEYKVSKQMKKSIGSKKDRSQYVFHQWDEVSAMKPVPAGKFAMINDHIEQVYKVDDGSDNLTFTLHDVMVLTHNPKTPKKFNNYLIENLKDFNIQYMIVLMRDPCKGLEKDLEDAQKIYQELSDGFAKLNSTFPNGEAQSVDQLKNFQSSRNELLKKYAHKDVQSPCPDLQKVWDNYNACVDSLIGMTCNLSSELAERAANSEMVMGLDGRSNGIDASGLLFKARQIDELVNAWKVTRNQKDRTAYKLQCEKIINDAENQVVGKYAVTKEQKDAVNTIRKAIQYFNKTCK